MNLLQKEISTKQSQSVQGVPALHNSGFGGSGNQLLAAANANNSDNSGVRCAITYYRGAHTRAYSGFPLCLNSEEKAEYVGKQFFELCCACYGVTPKMY